MGYIKRLRLPPPTGNQSFDQWAQELTTALNALPRLSWFSGTTPNSNLSGVPGDLAVNLVSGSTTTRLWLMGGNPTSTLTKFGWVTLMVGPP